MMEGSYFMKARDITTYHGCQQCMMMIISLSWGCHGVTCCCHKLLMSRNLSRGCVTCCPHQGPMCTGSDAPLVTRRLILRMRRSDQQVVARLGASQDSSFRDLTSLPHLQHSVSATLCIQCKKMQTVAQQLVIRLASLHSNSMLSCPKTDRDS